MMVWLLIGGGILLVFALTAFTGAPYVPTKPHDAKKVFTELYPLSASDVLVDIGSGDGMVLRAAARCGSRAIGLEINPFLVAVSRLLSRHEPLVSVRLANFWMISLPDETTVVYTFGESRDILKMAQKVQREVTRAGRRIAFISYAFEVPDLAYAKRTDLHFLYYFEPLQIENRKYNDKYES